MCGSQVRDNDAITRRDMLAKTTIAAVGVAVGASSSAVWGHPPKEHSIVYYTAHLTPESLVAIYTKISKDIVGKVAIKIHTGEPHGPNILPRDMVKALQQQIPNSSLVETNTLYKGKRYTTADHRETLKINGWDFCPVDIMDEDGAAMLPVKNGKHFRFFVRICGWN